MTNTMTEQQRTQAIARAEEIMKTMSRDELEAMAANPDVAFHAMCATLAATAAA